MKYEKCEHKKTCDNYKYNSCQGCNIARGKTLTPNQPNRWIKEARQKLIDSFGGRCQAENCNKKENLEFAHMKGFNENIGEGRGRKERYYAVVKNPNKYLLLCKEHHKQYDDYQITLEDGTVV